MILTLTNVLCDHISGEVEVKEAEVAAVEKDGDAARLMFILELHVL